MVRQNNFRASPQILKNTMFVIVLIFLFIGTNIFLTSVVQAASFPSLRVEPQSIEFESLEVGSSSPVQTVTISNYVDSTNVLTIFDIYVSGPDSDDFMIVSDHCSGRILDGSISSTLEIVFTPTTVGNREATLMIPTNATAEPYKLALSGIGITSNSNLTTKSIIDEGDNLIITDQVPASNDSSPSMSWGWILVILSVSVLVVILITRTKGFKRK
ncbi:MAG: choice-of-anchor D domain-containing protein [Dehalococcoidia bacterium]|nr:MAG: choice-of-anchor D domain-containing protein [Dehalococcoidia bacterium]